MPNVYLIDIFNTISTNIRPQMLQTLQGYFNQLAKPPVPAMTCSWLATTVTATDLDILVYFLPFAKSLARKIYPKAPSPISGHDGLTIGDNPRISEVYVHTVDPTILADLTLHEIMHMKLKKGNEMHVLGGMAAATVTPTTKLTPQNIQLLAPALKTPLPQWTAGIQMMLDMVKAKASGDPMVDLLE
jgi:hypothetical protein